jgi:ubiquinone/menaquinone biosynthesis C-methylase UbiE
MGFFDWAAPLVRHWGDRWTEQDALQIGGWLRPVTASGGRILDVGGGSGQLSVLLAAALDAHVTVLDPTPDLVKHVPEHPNVVAVLGTAEEMPFPDSTFDALLASDAFHHFRDQDASVREFCRVVRPGGSVLLLELDPTGFSMRLIRFAERLVGEPGSFLTVEGMCSFMAERGIRGDCERIAGPNYRFLGTVVKPEDVA